MNCFHRARAKLREKNYLLIYIGLFRSFTCFIPILIRRTLRFSPTGKCRVLSFQVNSRSFISRNKACNRYIDSKWILTTIFRTYIICIIFRHQRCVSSRSHISQWQMYLYSVFCGIFLVMIYGLKSLATSVCDRFNPVKSRSI